MPLLAPPALPAPAPSRAALEAATAVEQRALTAFEKGPGPEGWKGLRSELRGALALRERHLGRHHPQSLALRGLLGLVGDRAGDPRGLGAFAAASGELNRQLRLLQRVRGQESPELIPFLEALERLFALESLQVERWEELALRIAIRHSTGPRPDLERRVVAALERHFGGFLSFKPPDRDKVLQDAERLVALWLRRGDAPARTREFAEVALRGAAAGVWRLVGVGADEGLRAAIGNLLEGLDPEELRKAFHAFLDWVARAQEGPWRKEARHLAEAVDRRLAQAREDPVAQAIQRFRLAEALGEGARGASLLADAFRGAASAQARDAFLAEGERVLGKAPSPELEALLEEGVRQELPRLIEDAEGRMQVEAQAARLEAAGRWIEAEARWRALAERPWSGPAERGPRTPPELGRRLGENLRAQGRLAEARAVLERLAIAGAVAGSPELRFALGDLEARLGNLDQARLHAREGLARLPEGGALHPLPGLAFALDLLQGDAASGPRRDEVLARVRRALDPEGRLASLADPKVLIALLGRLEQDPEGAWTDVGKGPEERAFALLRGARGLPVEAAQVRRGEALGALGGLWGAEDPRLIQVLVEIAGNESDPGRAEPLLRRAVAIWKSHPGIPPEPAAEALAKLGTLLGENGRVGEARALLRGALPSFTGAVLKHEQARDTAGAVFLTLLALAEEGEDYPGALELMGEAERMLAEAGMPLPADLAVLRTRFERLSRVQTLLRGQGLD